MPLEYFHPAVKSWFEKTFAEPTAAQIDAWPGIKTDKHTLIAAPTGSGKTLAAFMAAIDTLVRQGLEDGLRDETQVVYVSPLKALSNDINKNLELPLSGIRDELLMQGLPDVEIRAMVRTGDTPQSDRARMRRQPPHILVTTPESLYILLTSDSGRRMLSTTRSLIVDEIHALAGNKRGSHLSLSIERLQDLCAAPVTRIGLSATQKPISTVAHFLLGNDQDKCNIVDSGHVRDRDLDIETLSSPLQAVMSGEAWAEIYDRLAELVEQHRTTLIFVNTRRLAERVAKHLGERLGEKGLDEDCVTSHHGSLSREHRLDAEQRLKSGKLRALVATASLELGIDIGEIDLVCQMGSPRAISTLLQRVGRAGHAVGSISKGRLFPQSRDDLVECVALLNAVRLGELDALRVPPQPLDVVAQQIVAELSCGERSEDELFQLIRKAWPYHALTREDYDAVLTTLSDGYATRRGRRSAYVHRDAVNRRLRPRRGARLTAITNGGAIPDQFDYDVVMQPEGIFIGTLGEDFAFESLPGDIFQLGNTSYQILRVEQGKVHVQDAHGQPPNIPFWFGEAPGRSDELSIAVSRLRSEVETKLATLNREQTTTWLAETNAISLNAAGQLIDYLAEAYAALGGLPTQNRVVLERFFDEAGDQHLVVHSSFGSRLNRAWGLSLRKRFCRKFNFELQAAALEDSIVLSLGSTHSFVLEDVASYLKSVSVRDVLTQALLDVPMFATQWRRISSIALAVKRFRNGKKAPAQFQRMDAEDLLAVIFPDQLACAENLAGKREIPVHPLVAQSIDDCLHEAMDLPGLENVLKRIENRDIEIVARDLVGPSPLAQEILSARPYAFLDDGAAEERRTQLVQVRQFTSPEDAVALGALDLAAIELVREQAWPQFGNADELHDALMLTGFFTEQEATVPGWQTCMDALIAEQRATRVIDNDRILWTCAERLGTLLKVLPEATLEPRIAAIDIHDITDRDAALLELVRARLECVGPVSAAALAQPLGLEARDIDAALLALESEGFVMRGVFTPGAPDTEWCERGLLARIHRYTVKRLRQEIKPVSTQAFMRFLFQWQGIASDDNAEHGEAEGQRALEAVLSQLEGIEAPASAWESDILPARIKDYSPLWLDNICATGRTTWARLSTPAQAPKTGSGRTGPIRSTPVALISRRALNHWRTRPPGERKLSSSATTALAALNQHGASFFDELVSNSGLLHSQLEEALAELATLGLITSDSFIGLRALLLPLNKRKPIARNRRRRGAVYGVEDAGRWSLLPTPPPQEPARYQPASERVEYTAGQLLHRYGVVFRKLLERENNLPSWRELLYVYRRMEARGDVRGGRFVDTFAGEQFALPEAVGLLRDARRNNDAETLIAISAADPLNLTGVITPGQHVPSLTNNRVLYRAGKPVAVQIGGKLSWLEKITPENEWELRNVLLRKTRPSAYVQQNHRPV